MLWFFLVQLGWHKVRDPSSAGGLAGCLHWRRRFDPELLQGETLVRYDGEKPTEKGLILSVTPVFTHRLFLGERQLTLGQHQRGYGSDNIVWCGPCELGFS
ncbi:hypothetical protein HanRHA438_Chr15g0685801 [Helianthus annuus]|nr:hypothetical protein HanHA89_Chr15g0597401 [Helianthus annuus]KAJ0647168.1 hypothetical protein HanLR1_Chr15g0558911 [Helianthus annuus]KAJ0842931.1 hypothetical protein HanRHA438_Chr15g0685801 [Helianthus annuus]